MSALDSVNACSSGSYSSLAADPRGVSTTTCASPSSLRTGSLSRSAIVPGGYEAALRLTPLRSATVESFLSAAFSSLRLVLSKRTMSS